MKNSTIYSLDIQQETTSSIAYIHESKSLRLLTLLLFGI